MVPPHGAALSPDPDGKISTTGTAAATLVAIDGPLKNATFAIGAAPFTIGRKSDNALTISDLSLSRNHCSVRPVGDGFCLSDHDSQNGTFLNGVPVRERRLDHGDQIAVGTSAFVFLMAEDTPQEDAAVLRPTSRPSSSGLRHRIVGESPAIRQVLEFISQVAALDSAVLIAGEAGTGKELVARTLHENSGRPKSPFVVMRCTAWGETALERELFGYEAGAFTGAASRKKGTVELAQGGSIFLDEVAELSRPLQEKLLRLVQEKRFERLGGDRTLAADVRILAASSRDLAAAAQAGTFHSVLYFRLGVLSVQLPLLRERREDIPLLANYFRCEESVRRKRRVLGITAAARECLLRHNWPGNVRELECAIAGAVAAGATEGILPENLPDSVLPGMEGEDLLPYFHRSVLETKRSLILKAYQQARGVDSQAAALLGLHPTSLHRLVRTLDLKAAIQNLNGRDRI